MVIDKLIQNSHTRNLPVIFTINLGSIEEQTQSHCITQLNLYANRGRVRTVVNRFTRRDSIFKDPHVLHVVTHRLKA